MPTAGVDCDVVIGPYGFHITPKSLVKSDISPAIPRIAVATSSKSRSDFSELDTQGQFSWHHGRGQEEFLDEASFMDSNYLDTRIQGQVIPAPNIHTSKSSLIGTIVDMVWWPKTSKLYALLKGTTVGDNALYVYDNTASTWSVVAGATALIQGTACIPNRMITFSQTSVIPYVVSTDYIIISLVSPGTALDESTRSATGNPQSYILTTDGTTFSAGASTATGTHMKSLASSMAQFYERFAFSSGNNTVVLRQVPDANSNDNTTNDIIVRNLGSPSDAINRMVVLGESLLVLKTAGIWAITRSADGSTYLGKPVVDYSTLRRNDNGTSAIVQQGLLYFNILQSLWEFNGTTVRSIGPDTGAHLPEPTVSAATGIVTISALNFQARGPGSLKRGAVTCLAHSGNWLFAGLDNSTYKPIFAYAGTGWHEMTQLLNAAPSGVWFFPALAATNVLSKPNLFYGDGSVLGYLILPEGTDNPFDYSGADFVNTTTDGCNLLTSWFNAQLPEVGKEIIELFIRMDTADPETGYLKIYYQLDNNASYYLLGEAHSDVKLGFRVAGQTTPVKAKRIRYKICFIRTSSGAAVPILREYFHRFITRPDTRYGWTFQVEAELNMLFPNRVVSTVTEKQWQQRMWKLRDEFLGPQRFDDGTAYSGLTNLVCNPDFLNWKTGPVCPSGFTIQGTAVASPDAQVKWRGSQSAKITCLANGDGVRTATANFFTLNSGTTYHVVARVRILSGNAGTVTVSVISNFAGTVIASVTHATSLAMTNPWTSLGVEEFTRVSASGTPVVQLTDYEILVVGTAGCVFWVDGVEVREGTDDDSPFVGPNEPRCFRTSNNAFLTSSFRPPFYLVLVSGMTEAFQYPATRLNAAGTAPLQTHEAKFVVNVREAF